MGIYGMCMNLRENENTIIKQSRRQLFQAQMHINAIKEIQQIVWLLVKAASIQQ